MLASVVVVGQLDVDEGMFYELSLPWLNFCDDGSGRAVSEVFHFLRDRHSLLKPTGFYVEIVSCRFFK
jgi:hypothetical protein